MVSAPVEAPGVARDGKDRLRLWIRLLRASRTIEAELRDRLKKEFATTLPRFDVMAALYRRPEGMLMSDLSSFLLVSNGNITQLRTRLSEDGLIETATDANDRRIQRVRLTPRGQGVFNKMAKAHAACVDRLLGGLSQADKQALTRLLDGAKASIRRELEVEATP